jgi:hypothetical protein
MVLFPKVPHWRQVNNPDAELYRREREREEKRKAYDHYHQLRYLISKLDAHRDRDIVQELLEELAEYEKPEPPRAS